MAASIHHIATRVPRFAYSQALARDQLKNWAGSPRSRRLIHAIYNLSGINTRHSVVGDFLEREVASLFKVTADGIPIPPTTAARNKVYAEESRRLAVDLAREIILGSPKFAKEDITHIIFASCTGFANPGPDYHIIRELGLNPDVQRYTLGFMGCYAALPALRMAAQFCDSNPRAVVLVMCLELCTLHMQISDSPDSILANSLFADGAAAAIVSARCPAPNTPTYRLDGFASTLLPSGERDMAWEIGDHGFNIVLSTYIPQILEANLPAVLAGSLDNQGLCLEDIKEWAVHPGGRSILDKVVKGLHLDPQAVAASRRILEGYGNMSSATILFVLKEMLERPPSDGGLTCAMAFGPGLTVETAFLQRIGRFAPSHALNITQSPIWHQPEALVI